MATRLLLVAWWRHCGGGTQCGGLGQPPDGHWSSLALSSCQQYPPLYCHTTVQWRQRKRRALTRFGFTVGKLSFPDHNENFKSKKFTATRQYSGGNVSGERSLAMALRLASWVSLNYYENFKLKNLTATGTTVQWRQRKRRALTRFGFTVGKLSFPDYNENFKSKNK